MDSTIRTFKGLEMNEMVIGFTMLGVYVLFGLIVLAIAFYLANRLTPIKKDDDQEIREHWETRGKTTFTGAEYVSDSWVETTTVGAKRVGSRFVPIILLFGFLC